MLIFAMISFVIGCWLVILSGKISGKTIEPESFLEDGGLTKVLKYIFTHNPFTGYRQDFRILAYGLSGLLLMIAGAAGVIYFAVLFYLQFSR